VGSLHVYARRPHTNTRSGADKAAKNADDKTAFEVAELNEHTDVTDLLK
jgi:ankyrin repeat protein